MMAGFLEDPINAGAMSLGLRLLATPGKFGQALGTAGLGAMNDMDRARVLQTAERNRVLQDEMLRMQIEQVKRQQAERDAQRAQQGTDQTLLRTMMENGAQGPAMPPDPRLFMSRGGSLEGVQNLMGLNAALAPKVPKFSMNLQYDQNGRAFLISEDGSIRYLDGVKSRDKLISEDAGGKKVLRTEYSADPVGEITKTMTPGERDSSARGWKGLQLQGEKNQIDGKGAEGMKAPSGYRFKADGNLEAIPGGPADTKIGGGGAKVQDAKDVLSILEIAEPLVKGSTGSYLGAGIDQVARAFGATTPGASAGAQLKTLQGALISKMPKMSGPQSDKDVQLYREMAGQIGDATLPRETRLAAIETIRQLNEQYAGIEKRPIAPPDTSAGIPKVKFLGFEE